MTDRCPLSLLDRRRFALLAIETRRVRLASRTLVRSLARQIEDLRNGP